MPECKSCPEFFNCPLVQPGLISPLFAPQPQPEGLLVMTIVTDQNDIIVGIDFLPL